MRWIPAVVAVVVRPWLWPVALRQVGALAPTGWWRRAPYLPLPDANYLSFRLQTQYGGTGDTRPAGHDVVTYLRWCRRMRRLA